MHDSILYVAGGSPSGSVAEAANSLWSLDLAGDDTATVTWKQVTSWPGGGRLSPSLAVQFDGYRDSLYLIGGVTSDEGAAVEVFALDLKKP